MDYDQKDLMKFFGITNNPKKAGYILSNGKFLDFSGNHLSGHEMSYRLRHDSITGTNTNGYCLVDDYPDIMESDCLSTDFVNKFKVVRCRFDLGEEDPITYIMSLKNITSDQKNTILKYCSDIPVIFDIIDGFDVIESFEFNCFDEDCLRKVYHH